MTSLAGGAPFISCSLPKIIQLSLEAQCFLFVLIYGKLRITYDLSTYGFLCRALNSNRFNGTIPPSIGNLSNIDWLDLSDNQFEGPIPVSGDQGQPGLDLLLKAHHLYVNSHLSVFS